MAECTWQVSRDAGAAGDRAYDAATQSDGQSRGACLLIHGPAFKSCPGTVPVAHQGYLHSALMHTSRQLGGGVRGHRGRSGPRSMASWQQGARQQWA